MRQETIEKFQKAGWGAVTFGGVILDKYESYTEPANNKVLWNWPAAEVADVPGMISPHWQSAIGNFFLETPNFFGQEYELARYYPGGAAEGLGIDLLQFIGPVLFVLGLTKLVRK